MKIESYIYRKLKFLNALTQINTNNLMKNMDYGLLFSMNYFVELLKNFQQSRKLVIILHYIF